jgi:hypothetical protein
MSAVGARNFGGSITTLPPAFLSEPPNERVSAASVKAGATGAYAAGVTAKLVGCIR